MRKGLALVSFGDTTIPPHLLSAVVICCLGWNLAAEERCLPLDDLPQSNQMLRIRVNREGTRIYVPRAGIVLDDQGKLVRKLALTGNTLIPGPDDTCLIAVNGGPGAGHIGIVGPDGREVRRIVGNDWSKPAHLRCDMTGWSSPTEADVDWANKRVFACDSSQGSLGQPNPYWSRIACFDLDGKFLADCNRYNFLAAEGTPERDKAREQYYSGLACDPQRQRVYCVTRSGDLFSFAYDGTQLAKVNIGRMGEDNGSMAVFPDGRLGVKAGREVRFFETERLTQVEVFKFPEALSPRTIAVDGQGRIFSGTHDPRIAFLAAQ